MVAGLNILANIWRINYDPDDVIGGAVISGTVQFRNIRARLQADEPTQVFMEQGLETNAVFSVVVIPGTLDIRERDEFEIIAPYDHPDINHRFRIVGVQHSSHVPRDPRNYLILNLTRSRRAHARQ